MGELSKLPNIGKVVETQLNQVGIETESDLRKAGAKEAWRKIRAIDPSACYNRLCGLEGALLGIRWHHLPVETKKDLKDFYTREVKGI